MKYQILLYRTKTRHKLIMRFNSYWKLAEWIDKNVKPEDLKYYDIRKSYNKK